MKEKATLEARLVEINEALGVASATTTEPEPAVVPKRRGRPAGRKKAAKVKSSGRGRRARNKLSLKEAVLQAISKKPLGRQEIVQAVKKLGYKFSTGDPLNSVSAMLYSNKKTFKNENKKFSPA